MPTIIKNNVIEQYLLMVLQKNILSHWLKKVCKQDYDFIKLTKNTMCTG